MLLIGVFLTIIILTLISGNVVTALLTVFGTFIVGFVIMAFVMGSAEKEEPKPKNPPNLFGWTIKSTPTDRQTESD